MSKPDLASIYAMMPERQQAQGFVEYVKALIADGSVEKAGAFFNALCQVEGCDYAKTAVGSALITGYLDIGDKGSATEVYRFLESLGTDEEILRIRANALLSLSACKRQYNNGPLAQKIVVQPAQKIVVHPLGLISKTLI